MSRLVRHVLIHRKFKAVRPETTVAEAAAVMKEAQVGSILIMEDGALAGIFTERDALYRVVAARLDPAATSMREVMSSELVTVAPDDDISHALRLMRDIGFRHLPVVEDGKLCGIVSIGDAVKHRIDELQREGELLRSYIASG